MKEVFAAIIIACFSVSGFAQEDVKTKAADVLVKAKKASFKDIAQIERIFVETASRYSVRKAKLKKGMIPSYEFKTELWIEKPGRIKSKTLTSYPGNSFQLTENTLSGQTIQRTISLKDSASDSFSQFFLVEPGDPKRNEEILRQTVRYESFSRSFPIFLFSGEDLNFEYAGAAKSGEQSADVLTTSIADNYKVKLYFDEKTRQMLLMSVKFSDPKTGEEVEHKYFFSDYKEKNGVNFAHKVIIQENGEVIEERDVKLVELNPRLASEFFAVKK